MKTYTVNPQQYTVQFTTTGVVKPIAGHKAEVAAPFEGRIVKSFIKLGQKVTTGTPLFQISSSDYLESVRMFHQAGRERELAERNYLRKKELMEKGISSSKEYDEAKLEFDLADKEYEKTAEILKIFNWIHAMLTGQSAYCEISYFRRGSKDRHRCWPIYQSRLRSVVIIAI